MNQDNYQPPSADITPNQGDDSDESDVALFAGSNSEYYVERYRRMQAGSGLGWHWPAFFLTSGWLLYRKMWLPAVIYIIGLPFLVVLLITLAAALVNEAAGGAIYFVYVVALFFVVPVFANRVYLSFARGRIDKINAIGLEEDRRRRFIQKSGGTSFAAAIIIMIVPLTGVLAAIAIPAYQDYTIRAQVSMALNSAAPAKAAVAEYYRMEDRLPLTNAEAGLEDPARVAGGYVASVAVESGTIVVTFGNDATMSISGQSMLLVPTRIPGGLEWRCERGSLEERWVPASCR